MTGSTSATSSTVVGVVELREVATRLGSKNGREGKMAKLTVSATKPLVWPEMDRSDDGLKGISGDGGSGEVVAVDSGVASARGSAAR